MARQNIVVRNNPVQSSENFIAYFFKRNPDIPVFSGSADGIVLDTDETIIRTAKRIYNLGEDTQKYLLGQRMDSVEYTEWFLENRVAAFSAILTEFISLNYELFEQYNTV